MPCSCPSPSSRKNSPACVPPVTSITSVMPARTSASIAYVTIGRSWMGSRCLLVIRVSGCSRVPFPPASTTPFIAAMLNRPRTSADDQRPAVRALLGRPDADDRAARRGDGGCVEAEPVRPRGRPGPPPRAARTHLDPVGPYADPGTDLAPQRRTRAAPARPVEREAEGGGGGLRNPAGRDEPGLEPVELRLVAEEVLDQRR